jgi:NADH-quinone oxidoreductase subunit J
MIDMAFVSHVFQWVVFVCAAVLALLGAIMMVTRRDPIHGALWLIVAFFSLAVIYLTLGAQFIAVAQVIVYAGAIMMLIIFVIMLIHLETGVAYRTRLSGPKAIGAVITIVLFLEIAAAVFTMRSRTGGAVAAGASGTVAELGTALYGRYLFPFEIASVLLLVGIVGAVILARRGRREGLTDVPGHKRQCAVRGFKD